MSEHTPGPWKFEDVPGCKTIKGGKLGTKRQAQYQRIATTEGHPIDSIDAANARLIVAAPDLLAACEEALSALTGLAPNTWYVFEALEDAIAKARGEA